MYRTALAQLLGALLAGCTLVPRTDVAFAPDARVAAADTRGIDAIDTLVVIYAENRAFDTLFGLFPGANGIPGVNPGALGTARPRASPPGPAPRPARAAARWTRW